VRSFAKPLAWRSLSDKQQSAQPALVVSPRPSQAWLPHGPRQTLVPSACAVCTIGSIYTKHYDLFLYDARMEIIPMSTSQSQAVEMTVVSSLLPREERRSGPRLSTSELAMTHFLGDEYKEEVHTLSNRSRKGVYFETRSAHYKVGMPISVSTACDSPQRWSAPSFGKVVRIDRLAAGNFGIAVRILMR
jgi:hypothetical protein